MKNVRALHRFAFVDQKHGAVLFDVMDRSDNILVYAGGFG